MKPTFFVCDECAFSLDEISLVNFVDGEPGQAIVCFRSGGEPFVIENPENVKALVRTLTLHTVQQ